MKLIKTAATTLLGFVMFTLVVGLISWITFLLFSIIRVKVVLLILLTLGLAWLMHELGDVILIEIKNRKKYGR